MRGTGCSFTCGMYTYNSAQCFAVKAVRLKRWSITLTSAPWPMVRTGPTGMVVSLPRRRFMSALCTCGNRRRWAGLGRECFEKCMLFIRYRNDGRLPRLNNDYATISTNKFHDCYEFCTKYVVSHTCSVSRCSGKEEIYTQVAAHPASTPATATLPSMVATPPRGSRTNPLVQLASRDRVRLNALSAKASMQAPRGKAPSNVQLPSGPTVSACSSAPSTPP